jgi:hypothetical protein
VQEAIKVACCGLATTTQPRAAAVRALTNKQYIQASRVAAVCYAYAFVQSEHAASSTRGAGSGGPEQLTGRQPKPGEAKQALDQAGSLVDLREPARAAPRTRKYRRAACLGCNAWGSVAACCSTAVTAGFVR